jgi:hypothetical protein
MKQELVKSITTDDKKSEFQIRFFKNDGVGLLTDKDDKSYLILDSIDYWYDLIQEEYPPKKKCSCKNDWFNIQFEYNYRFDTDEIKEIKIHTHCTNCKKNANFTSIDIDYSPTDTLISNPITYCETPRIKYKFTELTSYWSGENLTDFLRFVFFDLKLYVYCWFFKHPEGKRYFEKVSFEKAIQIITVNHRYLNFYFALDEIDTSLYHKFEDDNGIYVKNGIWRRDEIIQLTSPYHIFGVGLLYYLNFCNQFLNKGNVQDKSDSFEQITTQLRNWLKGKFISKRGKNCFDGYEAYERFKSK